METTATEGRRRPAGEAASPSVRMDITTYRRLRLAAVTRGTNVQALTTLAVNAHLDQLDQAAADVQS